ncbi:ArsR family transcriptional regulator [Acrocarpospora corrugata]|uniref:ArsR family transcriptional regulator n=1 Tax=Acrocarpospora corrugata TaxID=35763 RepID=A0A5M3W933_9ACTN|nr:ArsR family transcriptional regulator [Acrocarpospora corrugata]GES03561.1 ArsR family transcriptional regulator [Acrocarpospora corrugata]
MVPSAQAAPAFLRLAAHPLRWQLLSELAATDYRVRELVELIGQPQNLISYHLRLLRGGGLVTARRSTFDARDSYYHLDLERCAQALADTGAALHPALRPGPAPLSPPASAHRAEVLFACTGNSARSPIAEALLRRRAGNHVAVTSAGSHPRPQLHPDAVRALREGYGIDLKDQRPRHLEAMAGRRFDYVISLCDKVREVCPDFGDHPRRIHWSIPDPATAAAEQAGYPAFARTAAEIDTRIQYLLPVLTPSEAQS